jgi:hypothetical protein
MAISYDDALAVQRRHESALLALPGVNAVGVKQRDEGLVLEVTTDEDAALPAPWNGEEIDGLPLRVVHGRYKLL